MTTTSAEPIDEFLETADFIDGPFDWQSLPDYDDDYDPVEKAGTSEGAEKGWETRNEKLPASEEAYHETHHKKFLNLLDLHAAHVDAQTKLAAAKVKYGQSANPADLQLVRDTQNIADDAQQEYESAKNELRKLPPYEKSGNSMGAKKGWEKRKQGGDTRSENTAKSSWMTHAPTYSDEEASAAETSLEKADLNKIPRRRVSVAISRLIPNLTQEGLDEDSVKKYMNDPAATARGGSKLPQAYRHNGKVWLIDGHHRVEAAYRRGEKNVDVDIYDFDQIGKSEGAAVDGEASVPDFSAEYPQPFTESRKRKRRKPVMRGLHLPDGMYVENADCDEDEMLALGVSRLHKSGQSLFVEMPVTAPRSIQTLVSDFFRTTSISTINSFWRYGVAPLDVMKMPPIQRGPGMRQSLSQVIEKRPFSLFKSIAADVAADRLSYILYVEKAGDKPGHVFHGNQWTHGESTVVMGTSAESERAVNQKDAEDWGSSARSLVYKMTDYLIDHKIAKHDPLYEKAFNSLGIQQTAMGHAMRVLGYHEGAVIFSARGKDGRVQAVCSFNRPPESDRPWTMSYMATAPWNNHYVNHLLGTKPEDKEAVEQLAISVVKTALEHNVDLEFYPASEEVAHLYTMLGARPTDAPAPEASEDSDEEEPLKDWERELLWSRDSMRDFLSKHEKSDVGSVFDEPVIAILPKDLEEKADTVGHPFRGNQYKKIDVQKLPPEERVWQNKTEWGSKALSKPSRLELGGKGEFVAAKALESILHADFSNMNERIGGNSPIDLLGDTSAVEVKAGKTSNGRSAQHWRITHGEPGEEERDLMSKMSAEELREYNQKKTEYLVQRKLELTDELSEKLGKKLRPTTVGIIFDPRMKKADLFVIPGFHAYLPWSKYATSEFYAGTVNVPSGARSILDVQG